MKMNKIEANFVIERAAQYLTKQITGKRLNGLPTFDLSPEGLNLRAAVEILKDAAWRSMWAEVETGISRSARKASTEETKENAMEIGIIRTDKHTQDTQRMTFADAVQELARMLPASLYNSRLEIAADLETKRHIETLGYLYELTAWE